MYLQLMNNPERSLQEYKIIIYDSNLYERINRKKPEKSIMDMRDGEIYENSKERIQSIFKWEQIALYCTKKHPDFNCSIVHQISHSD